MIANPRKFEVNDPFGRKWTCSLRWLQNAISIRHADAVDVKWDLSCDDGTTLERVVALHHPALIEIAKRHRRELTDSLCIRLAAAYLLICITNWEDTEKTIINPTLDQLGDLARKFESEAAALTR
ncbi:MAG: hypothetical protein HY820_17750 [Acidobacteria bacterium]|nr:hypothetical protein [Acidobacteriota bacterium]